VAGISGVGVGIASGGALLIYAGLKGVNPLAALRDIASGKPPAILNSAGHRRVTLAGGDPMLVGGAVGFPPLLAALAPFRADRYSQARRWETGFSDCSSYIGKGFKSIGITPPGSSTVLEYLAWPMLEKLPDVMLAGPGDLLISSSHIAVVVNATQAMGQQNPARNVAVGTYKDIMYPGSYGYYRYKGAAAKSVSV
jgi:hypothetical protein